MGEKKKVTSKQPQKTGFDVLFPEIKVEGYDVKPWTFRQGKQLMPAVSRIIEKVGRYLEGIKGEGGNGGSLEDVIGRYPVHMIVGTILPEILDEAPEVVSVSLGITDDEVQEMPMAKVTALSILIENSEYLFGFFGKGGEGSPSIP